LVPDHRHPRRASILHARHARLRRVLGRARSRPRGDRVLTYHRLHDDPRQRLHPRGHHCRRARGRGGGGATDLVPRGGLLRDLRVRLLRDGRHPRTTAPGLPGLVERGYRQRDRRRRHGLLPVARTSQDRGDAEAASVGGDGRGRVRAARAARAANGGKRRQGAAAPLLPPFAASAALIFPHFHTPRAAPLVPRPPPPPSRSSGTTPPPRRPTGTSSPPPTSTTRPAAGPRAASGPIRAVPSRRRDRAPSRRA